MNDIANFVGGDAFWIILLLLFVLVVWAVKGGIHRYDD